MARRKTHKRKSGKRRIGAAGGTKDLVMEGVGTTAVLAYGSKLTAMIPAGTSPTIVGAGETVLGFLLAKKSKNGLLRGAGLGLFAMGVTTLLKGFGIAGAPGGGYQGPVDRRLGAPGNYPAMQTIGDPVHDNMAGFNPEMATVSGNEFFEEEEDYSDY